MKKPALFLISLVLLSPSALLAGDVGVNLNINLGHSSPVVVAPAPVPVVVTEPPLFLVPAALGFSVAVGVPYDMFFIDARYYLHRNNVWYIGSHYDGPWKVIRRDRLPHGLRKHKYEKIVLIRDEEYHHYRRDRDHYKGRHHRPSRHDRHDRDERHDDRGDHGDRGKHGKKDKHRGHDD